MYIDLIGGGGVNPSGTLEISGNGVYNVYSYASASVSVHPSNSLSETYTSNGSYNISGEFNGGEITIEVPVPQFITETLSVSINGTYVPGDGVDGFSQVTVEVPQSVTGYTVDDIIDGYLPGVTSINSTCSMFVTAGCWYTVETVNLPNAQYIAGWAFWECPNLTYVSAPAAVEIDLGCFQHCQNLSEAYLPNVEIVNDSTFAGCTKLQTVDVHICSIISDYAFYQCTSLSQISLPNVEHINTGAFANCWGLKTMDLPKCEYIDSNGFYRCSSMSQVSLPEVLSIGDYAFKQAGQNTLSLPKCLYVGNSAFAYCRSMSQAYLPRVSYLGNNAFGECNNLTELTIGTDWYYIPTYQNALNGAAFASGNGSIYVDAAMYSMWITAPGWGNFASLFVSVGDATIPMLSLSDGLLYGKTKLMGSAAQAGFYVNNITAVSLPSCEELFSNAFLRCSTITSVDLPVCTTLGYKAFFSASGITSISLPMCKYVGSYAFGHLDSLTSISLPACEYLGEGAFDPNSFNEIYLGPCSYIGRYAIRQMPNLSKLTINYSGVCELDSGNIFLPITSIYVPASLVNSYKAVDAWSGYASQIFPIE